MISFQQLEGPYCIPVYFQEMPSLLRSISLKLIVFVGSDDDESVGDPGLYHWFEHVPFRGTVAFPGGYGDTLGHFSRFGGLVSAATGKQYTVYEAYVPLRFWREALALLVDLVSRPLLTDEAISAERDIIRKEITRARSNLPRRIGSLIGQTLWANHPHGHDTLGSWSTLDTMDAPRLRLAHERGYDRSRCVLLAAGHLTYSDLLDEFRRLARLLPDHGLRTRRRPASYGDMPAWRGTEVIDVDTEFSSSGVVLLFPIQTRSFEYSDVLLHRMVDQLCRVTVSPLFRVVREERNLAYSVDTCKAFTPDGGYWGFWAETDTPANVLAVQQAFWDVLKDSELRSLERYNYVSDAIRSVVEMRIPTPHDYTSHAHNILVSLGSVLDEETDTANLLNLPHDALITTLNGCTPELGRTIIARGRGKE